MRPATHEHRRPSAGPVSRAVLRLASLAVACVVALAVVYFTAVRTELGQRVDDRAIDGRGLAGEDALDAAANLLDTISVTSLALGGVALVLFALARRRPRLAVAVCVSVAGATLTTEVLKEVVLERPPLVEASYPANSLPSGHATVAMTLAVGAVLVAPGRLRALVALVGVSYAGAVGVATLTAGWHRPSDAIAAYAIAIGWGAGVAMVLLAWRGSGGDDFRRADRAPVGGLLALSGTAILVATLAGLVLVLVSTRAGDLFVVHRGAQFAAGALAIGGSALVGVGALVRSLRGVGLDPPSRAPAAPPSRIAEPGAAKRSLT